MLVEKKDAKKARRAEMKANGLIKSKAEKKREATAAAAREQMIASGMIQLPKDGEKNQKRDNKSRKKKKDGRDGCKKRKYGS